MDSKELRGLYEAYSEVYAPTELAIRKANLKKEEVEIDEAVKGESSERRADLAAERRAGHRPKSAKEGERYASHKLAQMAYVKRQRMGEELDIFDVVLEFLQAEGYAETLEEAEWLMANVIDEEAIFIVLGEAQAARENPEGHDREERKKYAPVRGERTPMPPRGDKRREDFEKWYAANVR